MAQRIHATRIILFLTVMVALSLSIKAPVSAASNGLNKVEKSMIAGRTFQLQVTGKEVSSWSSKNSTIASVSNSGLVTANKKGTTRIYANLSNGEKIYCVVTVRRRQYSKYITNAQMKVMLNILGAVETGGQVYGQRDYSDFTSPYTNSSIEHSCTAGAYQEYGENLRQLLKQIKKEYPFTFKKLDTANIASDLTYNWDTTPYKVYAGSAKAKAIVKIISCKKGQKVQDYRAMDLINSYLKHIRSLGVTNVRVALFLADCEHQGGSAAVERVVARASNKNRLSSMYKSVLKDQEDTSNNNQIGDYPTRRNLVRTWIKNYIPNSAVMKI